VFWLDLLWLIPWIRNRRIEQAKAHLVTAEASIAKFQGDLLPYSTATLYLPERVRRPLLQEIEVVERTLQPVGKTVRKTRDNTMRDHLESISQSVGKFRKVLTEQNDQYVQSMIEQHSKLLVDELKLMQLSKSRPYGTTSGIS